MRSPKIILPLIFVTALAGCFHSDAQRAGAGAVAGGLVAGAAGGSVVGGAALGAAGGALCRDAGLC
ncbi:hypothetical protein ACFE33_11305 [Falsihalocynthiibacter sp. SS001]|uniref:hypothetical protein n=1 Tax=Falsihalocynthiibacter sp. SS001 TaxID=3349698 RepID=UPI0036D3DE06